MILSLVKAFESKLGLFQPNKQVSFDVIQGVVRQEISHATLFSKYDSAVDHLPKLTVGIVFSGGPAPGGHDVLCGILSHLRSGDQLIGFCGGPGGLLRGDYKLIDTSDMDLIEGLGGFDFLGTDRTKISTNDQFEQVKSVLEPLGISSLIIVGGDDSNTNALFLADALHGRCNVIGVPKTIDGDLQYLPHLPITFGFHTATQHYARLVQQLAIDAVGTTKYWHIVKLMGRSASHVTLEVAHQVMPNACILAEEINQLGWSLMDVIDYFTRVILDRLSKNKPYGIIIFPEGIADVIPELDHYSRGNAAPLNKLLEAVGIEPIQLDDVYEDDHGNKNLSMLNSEKIIMSLVEANLQKHDQARREIKMMPHFFGYTGRAEDPTPFDSAYALLLGKTAYELSLSNVSGVIVGCDFSTIDPSPVGVPLQALVNYDEDRSRYVIKKHLVSDAAIDYKTYQLKKSDWVHHDVNIPRPELFDVPHHLNLDEDQKE